MKKAARYLWKLLIVPPSIVLYVAGCVGFGLLFWLGAVDAAVDNWAE